MSGQSDKKPWRDEKILRKLYHEKGMSLSEVADELGCGSTTVGNAMDDLGIETRSRPGDRSGPWRDEDTLRELYYERDMSLTEMADQFGCDAKTVQRWMDKYNLERDTEPRYPQLEDPEWLREKYKNEGLTTYDIGEKLGCSPSYVGLKLREAGIERHSRGYGMKTDHPTFDMSYGYIRATAHYNDKDGERVSRSVRVHRLLAVSEYGFDEVCGMDVHHKNGVPWDNRPENIELIEHGEHSRAHNLRQTDSWDRDPYEPQRRSD